MAAKMLRITNKIPSNILQQAADLLIEQGLLDPYSLPKHGKHPERDAVKTLLETSSDTVKLGYNRLLDTLRKRHGDAKAAEFARDPKKNVLLNNPKSYEEWLERQGTMQEFFQYTGSQMREMYETAMDLFEERDIDASASIYIYLIYLNPHVGWFWQGLGDCWTEKQQWPSAQQTYAIAIGMDPTNIEFYHSAVKSFLETHDHEGAIHLLQNGIDALKQHSPTQKERQAIQELEAGIDHIHSLSRGRR